MASANVACKNFGFTRGAAAFYGRENGTLGFTNVSCSGNESQISECSRDSWHLTNCDLDEAVYIVCQDKAGKILQIY